MKIERLTTLAFSMYSNKGAYVLLLGSGISRSAHIPTGWEIESCLIEQLAAAEGDIIKEEHINGLNKNIRQRLHIHLYWKS